MARRCEAPAEAPPARAGGEASGRVRHGSGCTGGGEGRRVAEPARPRARRDPRARADRGDDLRRRAEARDLAVPVQPVARLRRARLGRGA